MHKIKKIMSEYAGLTDEKRHDVLEIMEKYYKDLDEADKKEMGYELAVVVYGECLAIEEAQYIVQKMHDNSTYSECWTMDEIKSLAHTKGVNFEKEHYSLGDLYAMMHAEYYNHHDFICSLTSDHGKRAEYAFSLAHGFLNGEQNKGKARKYFHFVV